MIIKLWRLFKEGYLTMVGQNNYAAYLAHRQQHHADEKIMSPSEYFRYKEIIRFAHTGSKGCC